MSLLCIFSFLNFSKNLNTSDLSAPHLLIIWSILFFSSGVSSRVSLCIFSNISFGKFLCVIFSNDDSNAFIMRAFLVRVLRVNLPRVNLCIVRASTFVPPNKRRFFFVECFFREKYNFFIIH